MKPRPTACITYLLEEWIPRTQHGWGYSWIPSEKPWWGVSKVTGAAKPHCSQEKVLRTQCYWLRHQKSYFQVLHLFWKSQLFSFNTFENTTLRFKPLWNSISPQPDKKIIKKKDNKGQCEGKGNTHCWWYFKLLQPLQNRVWSTEVYHLCLNK